MKPLEEVSRPTGSDGVNPALLAYTTDYVMYDYPQISYYIHNYQLQSVDAVIRYESSR